MGMHAGSQVQVPAGLNGRQGGEGVVGAGGRDDASGVGGGYPSDLTDKQWALVEPLLPPARVGRRVVGGRNILSVEIYPYCGPVDAERLSIDGTRRSGAAPLYVDGTSIGVCVRLLHIEPG